MSALTSGTTGGFYGIPASSTTQNIPRSVSDEVRDLFPESAPMLHLVALGSFVRGKYTEQPGRISKKMVEQSRFESYTYTPLNVEMTAVSSSGPTNLVVSDASNIVAPYCVFNATSGYTARVDSISTNTLVLTPIGAKSVAAANFAVAGDKLIVMAPAYGQASQDPASIYKDEDNTYSTTQIVRFPVKISGTAKVTKSYFGDYETRMKDVTMKNGKRALESSFLFGERAAGSGNTTAGGAAYTTSFTSTRGLWNWAASTFDCGGTFTADKFRREIPTYYADNTANIVGPQSPMVMFCSTEVLGIMTSWVNMTQRIDQAGGDVDLFGLKAKRFQTSTFAVDVVPHELFNHGGMKNKALLFNPEESFYAALQGRDIKPNNNIQVPSLDGIESEIMGEIGLGTKAGGQDIMQITNIFNA